MFTEIYKVKMLKKLKEIRANKGYTQNDMAKILGYKHKSGYNNKLELGDRKITLDQAKIISDLFNLSIEVIFFD
ncbi:helix-turn-helix transcriptional regulator [Clostridium perfringens]|nr:helix-turn-helix transcriptional regulator [Clostridium perfringens]MDB2051299.1 helix-turn-helix transcriptional regulator [Clostridium perfringens]MDK0657944.1 helix-turn-helix transcriptional regulator [Clostridium perfringens]MDM0601516.1 helix-turn-helix transcriptional regulator [Clostridium perfringens]MDM0622748.1 helix-turn-helix transcriptional regulator [Clostridium perfringens]MDM0658479.1 helix-turn-helix transcriptional regulator [Clostridium perfringens]